MLMDHANNSNQWSGETMKSSSAFVPDGTPSNDLPASAPASFNNIRMDQQQDDSTNNNGPSFVDYALLPIPEGVTLTKYRGGITTHFPALLHAMLSRADSDGYGHIVNWMEHGRAFCVYDRPGFVKLVMPKYFRQTQFASFQRQLNLYGFQRLSVSSPNNRKPSNSAAAPTSSSSSNSNHHGAYFHAMFLRKRHDLCPAIQRATEKEVREQKLQKGKAVAHLTEPNLHAFPPMPPLDHQDVLQAQSVTNTPQQRKPPKSKHQAEPQVNGNTITEKGPMSMKSSEPKSHQAPRGTLSNQELQQRPVLLATEPLKSFSSESDWLLGKADPLKLNNGPSDLFSGISNVSGPTAANAVDKTYDSLFLGDDLCQPQLLPQPPASDLMEDMSWLEPTPLPEKPLMPPSQRQQAQVPKSTTTATMAKRSRSPEGPSMATFLDDVDFSDNDEAEHDSALAPPPNKMLASFDPQRPVPLPPMAALCPPHAPSMTKAISRRSTPMVIAHQNRKTKVTLPRCFADITTYSRAALVTKAESPFSIEYVNPLMMRALDESKASEPSFFCGKPLHAFCLSELQRLMAAAHCAKTLQVVQSNVPVQLASCTNYHSFQWFEATVGPFFMSQDSQQIGNPEYLVWSFDKREGAGMEMV